MQTMQPWEYDSPSPYPSALPPISDSDDEYTLSMSCLYTSISILPEAELRNMILRLAGSNPRFQRAIIKELSHVQTCADADLPAVSTAPSARQGRKRRPKSRRNPKNLSLSAEFSREISQIHHQLECVYHPGRLEEEVYEFISGSPAEPQVVRKISMWTCCDEDEWSPGCASTPSFLGRFEPCSDAVESRHTNIFPDSNVELLRGVT